MNVVWKRIKHKDIGPEELKEIAKVKDQYWTYGIDSQIEWIQKNLSGDDIHLLGYCPEKYELAAYLALVEVFAEVNSNICRCAGLSNVCVKKSYAGKGLGLMLVSKANEFITEEEKNGILLCKDSLASFYEKAGWKTINYERAYVVDKVYSKRIMQYGKSIANECAEIKISKNF